MFVIDAELKEFLEGGMAAQAGTVDAAGRPQITNAWGPRVNSDGSVSIFIESKRSAKPLANLATNRRIAVIFADPITYRSVQLKGKWRSTAAPTEEEDAWVRRHRDLFASATSLVGDNPESIRNLWMDSVTRIDFEVDEAFDQTPGPVAGQAL